MKIVRYTDDEWSALYVDGKLVVVGDHYLADDKLAEMFNVEQRNSDAFMLGGNDYDSVGKTLSEVESYADNYDEDEAEAEREENLRLAAELEAQAAALRSKTQR